MNDEEDKMTVDLRDTDDVQSLSRDVVDAECIFYSSLFSEHHDGENLIRCRIRLKWSHTLCASFQGEVFICDMEK